MSPSSKFGKADFIGFVCLVLAVASSALLLWAGETGLVGSKASKAPSWPANTFASLAWLGVLGLGSSVVVQLRAASRGGFLILTSLAGFFAFATGFVLIGIAWAGERQNYWDAIHFSSLIWHSVTGVVVAFVSARAAAQRGSAWGAMLRGPSVVCLLLLMLLWLWTWCQPVQELQADIARFFFLKLHG